MFPVKSFLLSCAYHVDGAAVVGVLGQHPDPLLQDVTVVHHNLTHILQTHRKPQPMTQIIWSVEHLTGTMFMAEYCTSVSLTMSMKASSGSGQDSCSHRWQIGWIHATRSTAEELCLMGTVPVCRGWSWGQSLKHIIVILPVDELNYVCRNSKASSVTWSTWTALSTLSWVVLNAWFSQ